MHLYMRTLKAIMATLILALATQMAMAQPCHLTTGSSPYFLTEVSLRATSSSTNEFVFLVTGQKSSAVHSPIDAKVIAVIEIEGLYTVLLQSEGEYFFGVSNLKNVPQKKDDLIKKGTLMGEAASNAEKKYEVEVLVKRKDKQKVTCEMIEKYLAGLQ